MRRGMSLMLAALLLIGALVAACAPATDATAGATTPPVTATATVPTPATPPPPGVAATLTTQAQRALGGLAQSVTATYDSTSGAATINVTVSGLVPMTDAQVTAAHNRVEQVCYWTLAAVWAGGAPLRQVTVIVLGPIQDEYANIVTDWYGVAVVSAGAARQLPWASIGPYGAWERYDQHILRTSYDLFD